MSWTVQVRGVPFPKGSMTPVRRGQRVILVEQSAMNNPGHKAWRGKLTAAGRVIASHLPSPLDQPVTVEVTFTLPRPSSRTGDPWPHLKPSRTCPGGGDIDKLTRLLLDAFTDAGVWTDDSRVIAVTAIKTYPGADVPDALDGPGATITVNTLPQTQGLLL